MARCQYCNTENCPTEAPWESDEMRIESDKVCALRKIAEALTNVAHYLKEMQPR